MSSVSPTSLESALRSESMPAILGRLFPPLQTYWPNLPQVSSPQGLFLLLDELEAFYGGAAGGGKSDALLAGALEYVDVPGYAALLLRRTYTDLALPGAIMSRSHEWLQRDELGGLKPHWSHERKTWTFPGGGSITFGYLANDTDVYRYQSAEFQYIGFDEATQFTEAQYTYMFSRLRRRRGVEVPIRMRLASNPGGVGHIWVKPRFITKRAEGVVFIPAKVDDNPGLDVTEYRKSLDNLSPILQQQLLEGDWGAFEGAAYEEFSPSIHCVPRMVIPDSWDRFESMDVGTTAPTAWFAFANDYDGNLIVFDGRYTPGTPEDHAPEILRMRMPERLGGHGWERLENGYPVRHNAYGDPASLRESLPIRNNFGQPLTLQEHYQNLGVRLIPANNRRQIGYLEVRSRLRCDPLRRFPNWHPNAGQPGSPRIFFVGENVPELVEQIQAAPLEPLDKRLGGEAVDEDWESRYGHGHAALRYGVTTRPVASLEPEQVPETTEELRAAVLRERDRRIEMDDEPSGFVVA